MNRATAPPVRKRPAAGRRPAGRRDPEATQHRILEAATEEFARFGYDGARIERIGRRAGTNDRSLYYYFDSKKTLFQVVLERVYLHLARAEQALNLEALEPREAMKKLIAFTWNYYLEHPEMITLLNTENLHRGIHIKRSSLDTTFSNTQVEMIKSVLEAGIKTGVFRADADPVRMFLTISALGYFYLSNRYTLSNYVGIDLLDKNRRAQWLKHITRVVLDHLTAPTAEGY